jgi:uncharacterized surface protein with fasciclin (FAS1) repeats
MANIVDTLIASGSFDILLKALQFTKLVDTLKLEGPFTFFAPNDDAFANIPKVTIEGLFRERLCFVAFLKLSEILTYHVVPYRIISTDFKKVTSAKTVQGQCITIDTNEGIKINDANVIKADIMADNGVIHAIDKIILPKD